MGTQSVAQFYNTQLLTGIDYFEPEVILEKYKRHGDQFLPLFFLLRSMGRERGISRETWFGFEDADIHDTFHSLNAINQPAPGVPVTLSVDPALDIDANGWTYLRDGDEILCPNRTPARVTNKTFTGVTWTFTLTPHPDTLAIGAISAGTELAIISGSKAGGTGPVEPATRNSYRKDYFLQLIKEAIAITGDTLSEKVYPKYTEDGKTLIGVYSEAFDDMEYRLNLKMNGAHWLEQPNTGVAPITELGGDGLQHTVYTTQGVIPEAITWGLNYNHGGTWTIQSFDALTSYLVQQRVDGKYIMFMMGNELANIINNALYLANLNTQINYTEMAASLFGGTEKGKSMAMMLNFSSYLHQSGYQFLFKSMFDFSNPKTFGAGSNSTNLGGTYGFPYVGVCMPLNKYRDPVSGNSQNNIEFCYKKLGSYSRRYAIWTISGAGEVMPRLTANDWSNSYGVSSTGVELHKSNQFIYIAY